MGAIEDLAAALAGADAEQAIAAENPWLRYKAIPDQLGGMVLKGAAQTGRYKLGDIIASSLVSGLGSGLLQGAGDRYQQTTAEKYRNSVLDSLRGVDVTEESSGLSPSLFGKAKNTASIFNLRTGLQRADELQKYDDVVNRQLMLETAKTRNDLIQEAAKNPRKAPSIMALIDKLDAPKGAATPSVAGVDETNLFARPAAGPAPSGLIERDLPVGPAAVLEPVAPAPKEDLLGFESIEQRRMKKAQQYLDFDPDLSPAQAMIAAQNDLKGELEADKASYKKVDEARVKAAEMLTMSDSVDQALGMGLQTGAGAGLKQGLARVGRATLGVGGDTVAAGELLESVRPKVLAMNRVSGSGSTSDAETKMYLQGGPGLEKGVEFNAEISRRMREIAERNRDYADFVDLVREKGGTIQKADQLWSKYERANPLWVRDEQTSQLVPNEAKATPTEFFFGPKEEAATPIEESQLPAGGTGLVATPAGGRSLFAVKKKPEDSAARVIAGSAMNMIPFGDEIAAGGNALIDRALGQSDSIGGAYDQRLAQAREVQEGFRENHPYLSATTGIGGAVAMPLGTTVKAGDRLLRAGAKMAGEGVLVGGAYGFSEGEGLEDRLSTAGKAAALGGVVSPALGVPIRAGIQAAPKYAQQLKDKVMGAKPGDFSRSATKKGTVRTGAGTVDDTTETILKKNLKQLEDEGILEGPVDPVSLANKHAEKSGALGQEIRGILNEVDQLRGGTRLLPKTKNAEDFIKTAPVDEREALRSTLKGWRESFKKETDGSLNFIQSEKEALYGKSYDMGQSSTKELHKQLARDLKETIENVTSSTLPKRAGDIKALNKRLGAFEETEPIFQRALGEGEGRGFGEKLIGFMRTSGGYGVPVIAGSVIGGAPGAIAGAAVGRGIHTLTSTPGGQRALANGLERSGSIFSRAQEGAAAQKTAAGLSALFAPSQSAPSSSSGSRGLTRTSQPLHTSASPGRSQTQTSQATRQPQGLEESAISYSSPNNRSETGNSRDNFDDAERIAFNNLKSLGGDMRTKTPASKTDGDLEPLLKAVTWQESRGKPGAVSPKGATGLMQIMPATGKEIAQELGYKEYDLKDPETNKIFGTHYLKKLLKMYKGDEKLALAAYNAGFGRVDKWIEQYGRDWDAISDALEKRKAYLETVNYVPSILKKRESFLA
jgi:soluble lytic murein transglycosylase-like protein